MGILERIPELACPKCKSDLAEGDNLRCVKCGRVYEVHDGIAYMLGDDVKALAEEIAVQDRVAREYEQKRYQDACASWYHDWWTEQMLARVRTDGRILDNGCGIGLLFEKVSGDRVVGLDISREMLRCAARRSDQLILGNSQELPFKDKSFDVVFCRSLLHHLPEPGLAVKEMARVLRSEGEAVLADTNSSIISRLPRMIARRGKHFSKTHKNMNRRMMERLLEPYFEVQEVTYFGYIAYPLLGFPDILKLSRFVPFKSITGPALISIDNAFSRVPLLRGLSWGIMVKAVKRDVP